MLWTANSATTYHVTLLPEALPVDEQRVCDAWGEAGHWMYAYTALAYGRMDQLWMYGPMVKRFRALCGRRKSESREHRLMLCGLMIAMCEDEANAAMRGEPTNAK